MNVKNYAGKFIVFEGLDGSGQSTQANLAVEYLRQKGHGALLTKEPTMNSEAGAIIDKVLRKKITMRSDFLQELYVEDRKKHLEARIIPALEQGETVVSDRYFFSTIAFGGIDLDMDWLIGLNEDFIVPDIVFILDVPVEVCLERISKRGEGFRYFEKAEKLWKTRANYQWIAAHEKFRGIARLIDGQQTQEEVSERIRGFLNF